MKMEGKTILFLHGFSSSKQATEALFFGKRLRPLPHVQYHAIDFNPTARDFEYTTTTGLINRLRQYVLDHDLGMVSIIGSSYGGLIALHYAQRFGGVDKMLLLAPGLFWLSGGLSEEELEQWKKAGVVPVFHPAFEKELPLRYDLQADGLHYLEPIPPPTPVVIIHGRNDTTVPTEHSRTYAAHFPESVHSIELDADHDLNDHLGLVWEHARSVLLGTERGGE